MDEPIPMPVRAPGWQQGVERTGIYCGRMARLGREKWQRMLTLLRAARTPQGRQRQVVPLMTLAAGAGLLLGLGLAWSRHRR